MGNEQAPPPAQMEESDTQNGYHILKVNEGSPADEEPYFDYLVAVDGRRVNEEASWLTDILASHLNKRLSIIIFSSKYQTFRESFIVPNNEWGGKGLFGCSIRYCSFKNAAENIWRILEIFPNSPAKEAGLRENTDYIIGTPTGILKDKDDLFAIVEKHIDKKLRLFVYNHQTDKCREVEIIPRRDWGGEGLLGCDIGFGYLHRIPTSKYGAEPTTQESVHQVSPKAQKATLHENIPIEHHHDDHDTYSSDHNNDVHSHNYDAHSEQSQTDYSARSASPISTVNPIRSKNLTNVVVVESGK